MSGGSHVSRGTCGESELSAMTGVSAGSAPHLPSPASAGAALVSPETLSRHSSPPPLPPHPHHQQPAPSCSSHRVHMESPLRLVIVTYSRYVNEFGCGALKLFWHDFGVRHFCNLVNSVQLLKLNLVFSSTFHDCLIRKSIFTFNCNIHT